MFHRATSDTTKRPGEATEAGKTNEIADAIAQAINGKLNIHTLKQVAKVGGRAFRISRKGIRLSGKGLADVLFATAPRIPVRTKEQLQSEFGGISGSALAGQMIRNASRNSAAVGG